MQLSSHSAGGMGGGDSGGGGEDGGTDGKPKGRPGGGGGGGAFGGGGTGGGREGGVDGGGEPGGGAGGGAGDGISTQEEASRDQRPSGHELMVRRSDVSSVTDSSSITVSCSRCDPSGAEFVTCTPVSTCPKRKVGRLIWEGVCAPAPQKESGLPNMGGTFEHRLRRHNGNRPFRIGQPTPTPGGDGARFQVVTLVAARHDYQRGGDRRQQEELQLARA